LYRSDELTQLLAGTGFRVERSFSFGFWPPFATDVWWWLQTAWLPFRVVSALGEALPPDRRVNHILHAVAV
jgi:hypothetical protein